MRSQGPAIIVGIMLAGLAGFVLPAAADPLPTPAPAAKVNQGTAPRHATATKPRRVAVNQLVPPALVPSNAAARPEHGIAPTPSVPVADPTPQPSGPESILRALGIGVPGAVTAFDAKQRGLVDRVNAYLTSVQTMVGNFVQVGPDGSRSEGQFYLMKPGRIRFEYNPPNPVELIADGQSLVVRDRKLATQDLYPLSQTPLRFLLADRIDLLKDTNLIGVYADDLFVTLVIEERQVFGGTHRLMLMFGAKDFRLRQWTITDPQGLDTTVAVYNLDTTKKPDPGMFEINYQRIVQ
jgi:outer membrane lipoprotein-sorting protein